MPEPDSATLLAAIRAQRADAPLSIHTLAEPILSENPNQQQQSPSSTTQNESSNALPILTPSTLAADLSHYRDLFSKLRFSYLEQVTKEKYLRSIVGDPPVLYTASDNAALEEKLVGMKAALKEKKAQSEEVVRQLGELAQQLAEEWDNVSEGLAVLEQVPIEIEELEKEVDDLRERVRTLESEMDLEDGDAGNARVDMTMGLEDTRAAIEERQLQIADVDAQIAALQAQLPAKTRECERADRELGELEARRNEATKLAMEVRRIREEGGRDPLEDQGRWLRGEEALLRGLLGIGVEG